MIIKGAIFDMDGTLLNSMDYWATVAEEYLIKNNIVPEPDTNKRFLEMGSKSWVEYYSKEHGFNKPFEVAKEEINSIMREKYNSVVIAKNGVIEMLDNLYNNGVKMCLATATDRDLVEGILKRLNMDKYFLKIFTTSEVGKGKAFPLIYETALSYLGTPKDETYIFEDASYAIQTAHSAGFKIVGVYDKNVIVPKEEIKSLCDIYLDENDNYKLNIDN